MAEDATAPTLACIILSGQDLGNQQAAFDISSSSGSAIGRYAYTTHPSSGRVEDEGVLLILSPLSLSPYFSLLLQ